MSTIAERIATLPTDKQAMLLQRLKQKFGQPAADASIDGQGDSQLPHASLSSHAAGQSNDVLSPATDPWIIRYQPNEQAHMRLFCFSYAGGGASIFRPWPDALPQEVEVCGVQLPGRESRIAEAAYTRITPLIQDLADAISPYLDRPFAFFGHSMGALVSFELARYLRRVSDKRPVHLYLAAYRAPQLPNPNIKIYHLPSEVFKVVLRAEGTPEMILQNEELMQVMLPTLRADFELCDVYEHQEEPPLECPFSIFGGTEDIRISAEDLEGWRIHTSGSYSQSMLPGSHFFVHSAQDLLLAAIRSSLEAQLNALVSPGPVNDLSSWEECHVR